MGLREMHGDARAEGGAPLSRKMVMRVVRQGAGALKVNYALRVFSGEACAPCISSCAVLHILVLVSARVRACI